MWILGECLSKRNPPKWYCCARKKNKIRGYCDTMIRSRIDGMSLPPFDVRQAGSDEVEYTQHNAKYLRNKQISCERKWETIRETLSRRNSIKRIWPPNNGWLCGREFIRAVSSRMRKNTRLGKRPSTRSPTQPTFDHIQKDIPVETPIRSFTLQTLFMYMARVRPTNYVKLRANGSHTYDRNI